MGTFYLTEPYCFIRKESERLKIYKERSLVKEIRVNDFSRIYIHDSSTLTTDALLLLAEKGVDVVYFSGNRMVGRFIGTENKNVRLRIAQIEAHLSEEKSLQIARHFVLAKLKNTRTSLQRFARRRELDLESTVHYLKQSMEQCLKAENLEELRGIEGMAAKKYFEIFPGLIQKSGFSFQGRSRRPAKDAVNALLNYGYALLRAEITGSLFAAGLDPYIGFLHRERYGRESLALDLMEEFRSILVDNLVVKLINQGVIKPNDFDDMHGEPRLKDHARKRYLQEFDQRRKDEVTHELLQRKMSYREIIHKQAILLGKFLKNETEDYYPFLVK
ncbi:CRISPR-associated endonuclease Cas1 [Lihuaxuella thermophila]|uniref:CRISPR-associated endonuclease Cas1 n=1 Tax=Lihuaxuella thermophila TaxID=1173111 RepID=A0A1H8E7W1_9BACL|nr:CRISPR-associated endonuclease Cas1 [Lihuaxuella thermophila]SEN14897.1 CRISP-associated protein Cas1 [Lihuaxuella thermophila]